jgi:TPR repeat protein
MFHDILEDYINGIFTVKTPIKNIKYVLIVTILLVLTSCASFDMAQNNEYLGSAYYEGKDGFKQDYAEALRYFKLAAAKNSLLAQYNLGTMYINGIGVKQDYTEALLYFKLAAAQNNSSAQTNLGYMYENGYGVTQNYTEASKWYKLAAAQNNFSAQANLGYLYYKGVGVSQNYAEALRYLKLSASQNYSDAQNFLGYMYENSIGGYSSQDNILAFVWTKLAAAQGNKSAITRSEIVNKKLTFIELSIAMKVSKECSSIKLKIVDCIDLAMLNNLTKNNDFESNS